MATKSYVNGGNMHLAPANGLVSSNGIMGSIASTILQWQERVSMRYQLADLDKQYLTDMGLSASEVKAETGKTFWQS
ncbi:DUF1127 domain-containing protein [Sneathiella sp. HT1-7]|jgi:uncharacterized protein YjiS (DUF1127 family)|uniref:DUF1127 domain-containing protein n=1 Tax=Sneathiella sp. HT1-7 TaxID=2887192 RepID=UPI001D158C8A|nr:hypothetical protein [Sneathiella sp. HT1-7]MCC3306707.1 hypothetical protein [Sneathiella sp. HT1-7]